MAGSKISLIAICMDEGAHTAEPQALIIGTRGAWTDKKNRYWAEGTDWRYACYPLSELVHRLGESEELLDDYFGVTGQVNDVIRTLKLEKNGALSKDEFESLEPDVFSSNYLNELITFNEPQLTVKRKQTALVARNVEKISFFSYDLAEFASNPFAVLDTARFVDPDATPAKKRNHPFASKAPTDKDDNLGSRVVLFPDLSDPDRPGALSGISINLQIKVAVSGHHIAQIQLDSSDRHDTRMLFELSVVGGGWADGGCKNLWCQSVANSSRGMKFDKMQLWCTTAPYKGKLKSRSDALSIKASDVLEYADEKYTHTIENDNKGKGEMFYSPVLDQLGVSSQGLVNADITRRFGFRALKKERPEAGGHVRKIGWRFETTIEQERLATAILCTPAARSLFPFIDQAVKDLSLKKVSFAQEQLFSAINSATTLTSFTRTIFSIRLGGNNNELDEIDRKITKLVLLKFKDAIGLVYSGLKSVRDGAPLSLLPRLPDKKISLAWHVMGSVIDTAPGSRTFWYPHKMTGKLPEVRLSIFEPCQKLNMWAELEKPLVVATYAGLPRLMNVARSFPWFKVELGAARLTKPSDTSEAEHTGWPAWQSAVSELEPDTVIPGTRIALKMLHLDSVMDSAGIPILVNEKQVADTHPVILQAFRFKFSNTPDEAAGKQLESDVLLTPLGNDGVAEIDDYPFAISALIRLPLAEVEPAAEDDIKNQARETARKNPELYDRRLPDPDMPLLLGMYDKDPKDDKTPKPLHLNLTAHEQVGRDFTHTVALSLKAVTEEKAENNKDNADNNKSNDVPRRRALIIEPSPFRIAAVDYQPITQLGTSQNNEVAVWNASGEGGESWRVFDDRQIVDIVMQPQTLGEAMEKNRSGLPGLPLDIQPEKPSAARFGSLTVLKIDPTYADTAFREPGWNLRRILGYATQRAPGSRVVEMRLEMLYGLLANIRADNLNITEIAGAIGEPPAALEDINKSQPHISRHLTLMRSVLKAEQRRLAVEKLWRDKPDADLQLNEGVSFRIRRNEPDIKGGPTTPLRWPVPGAVPADTNQLIDNKILQATFSSISDDSQSFPGGLAWAFESANLLMDVYGKPVADAGTMRGVFLTALGGFGSQRALFAHKKSIVESETTLGRVQRYRLERIGRISSLWHRAKHVIVYERTVVPPAQFFNKPPIGLGQDEHLGRAILRKVEEYVEILTPVRRYPEDGTSIKDNGFILGAEFKSIKIRVDSKWGHDVRREGWEVPLWNTMFLGLAKSDNPDDPAKLYPMPQICMLLAGKDGKPLPIEVANPEKLHFYTSVLDTEDDNTDAWMAVRDVDFCDFPLPQLGKVQPHNADLSDAMLPPAPAIIPGYERFTLSLVPSNELVSITHGRIADGPLTALRNVTIARSSGITVTDNTPIQKFGSELAAKAANVRAELDRRVGRVLSELDKLDSRNPDSLKKQAETLLTQALGELAPDKLTGAIKNTQDKLHEVSLPKLSGGLCEGIRAKVKAQIDGQFNRLVIIAADMVKASTGDLEKEIDKAAGAVGAQIEQLVLLSSSAEKALNELNVASQNVDVKLRQTARNAAYKYTGEINVTIGELQNKASAEITLAIDSASSQLDTLRKCLLGEILERRNATIADLSAVTKLIDGGMSKGTLTLQSKIDEGVAEARQVIEALGISAGMLTQKVRAATDTCKNKLDDARRSLDEEAAKIDRGVIPAEARRLIQVVDIAMASAVRACISIKEGADNTTVDKGAINQALKQLTDAQTAINGKLGTVSVSGSIAELSAKLETMLDDAYRLVAGPDGLIESLLPDTDIKNIKDALTTAKTELLLVVAGLDVVKTKANDLIVKIDGTAEGSIDEDLIATVKALTGAAQVIVDNSKEALTDLRTLTDSTRARLKQEINSVAVKLKDSIKSLELDVIPVCDRLLDEVSAQCQAVEGFANSLLGQAKGALADTVNKLIEESIGIQQYKEQLETAIKDSLNESTKSIKEIKAAAEKAAADFASKAEQSARQLVGSLQESVRDITGGADLQEVARRADGMYQKGDSAFRALAALGDPPKSNRGIDYNRTEVQFVMNAANKLGIDMTPSLALVNRAADQIAAVENAGKAVGDLLESFGVRLPLSNIGDALIPDSLKGLSVADMLPDIAGIDMKGLLQGVGFPDMDDSKAIKIRHTVDQASMQVFMDADLDIPFGGSAVPLMSFGPVQILIDTARLTATSRIGAGLGGSKASMNGKIFGDWRIVCSGQTILTFRKTGLHFDDSGKIDFRIQPDRIELTDSLKFITDLMGATGQKGGLRIEPFVRGGVPSGVAATLDMVLPPIQTGAFGISGLSLHVMFGLAALPEFEIVSELSIGTRTAPFTLNIWILNGGGYLTQRLSYLPSAHPKALMTYTLEIGVLAGLGLGFCFGVVSGGAWVQVGCSVAFTWSNGGSSTTAVRVFLLVRGNLDVCGLITASIMLLFEITYDGASVVGAGTLTVRAKISMFYTLRVDQHVEYIFTGEKKKQIDEDYSAAYC